MRRLAIPLLICALLVVQVVQAEANDERGLAGLALGSKLPPLILKQTERVSGHLDAWDLEHGL